MHTSVKVKLCEAY